MQRPNTNQFLYCPSGAIPQVLDLTTAAINIGTSGDNTVLAVAAGKILVVTYCLIMGAGSVTATLKTGSTAKSGALPLGNEGGCYPVLPGAFLEGADGEDFIINLSGTVDVDGIYTYGLADA